MLEELLAARGIIVSHETVRQWARKFGQQFGNHAQHGGTKAVFEMTYAGRLAMFAIRVSYPGGHSVWLTRRFPTVAWGLKKDALPFPTEADAARTIARLRPSGPVSIEPIAPEIAKPA